MASWSLALDGVDVDLGVRPLGAGEGLRRPPIESPIGEVPQLQQTVVVPREPEGRHERVEQALVGVARLLNDPVSVSVDQGADEALDVLQRRKRRTMLFRGRGEHVLEEIWPIGAHEVRLEVTPPGDGGLNASNPVFHLLKQRLLPPDD